MLMLGPFESAPIVLMCNSRRTLFASHADTILRGNSTCVLANSGQYGFTAPPLQHTDEVDDRIRLINESGELHGIVDIRFDHIDG